MSDIFVEDAGVNKKIFKFLGHLTKDKQKNGYLKNENVRQNHAIVQF